MDQIHLSPLVDQIQLTLGHISNTSVGGDADAAAGHTPPPRVPPPHAWSHGGRATDPAVGASSAQPCRIPARGGREGLRASMCDNEGVAVEEEAAAEEGVGRGAEEVAAGGGAEEVGAGGGSRLQGGWEARKEGILGFRGRSTRFICRWAAGPFGLMGLVQAQWAASCRPISCRAGPARWAEIAAQH
jgi:hypothetical protein